MLLAYMLASRVNDVSAGTKTFHALKADMVVSVVKLAYKVKSASFIC